MCAHSCQCSGSPAAAINPPAAGRSGGCVLLEPQSGTAGSEDRHTTERQIYLLLAIVGMTLAYYLSGRLGLLLAIPPGYATAVWPASGIALAGLLLYGNRLLPGIWLGSFAINVWTGLALTSLPELLRSLVLPTLIAGGATLQAAIGAALIRRYVGYTNILQHENRLIPMLLLGGPVACLSSASVGVTSLWLSGLIPSDVLLFNWWTWWVGDAIGVLVFTPIVLIWAVRPYQKWLHRQLTVTLPLLLMFAVVVHVFMLTSSYEQRRLKTDFVTLGDQMTQQLQSELDKYRVLVAGLASFYATAGPVTNEVFERFARQVSTAAPAGLLGMSWNPLVTPESRPAFEKRVPIFEVDVAGKRLPALDRPIYIPVAQIYYLHGATKNPSALGYDIASDAARFAAIQRAQGTNEPIVTEPITIVGPINRPTGVLLLQAVRPAATAPITGFVALVLDAQHLVTTELRQSLARGIAFRLSDPGSAPLHQTLFAHAYPEHIEKGSLQHQALLQFGQRAWSLDFILPATYDAFAQPHAADGSSADDAGSGETRPDTRGSYDGGSRSFQAHQRFAGASGRG